MSDLTSAASTFGTPLYVYHESKLRQNCQTLSGFLDLEDVSFFYAMKANSNPSLVKIISDEGLGMDCVSVGEVQCALRSGVPAERISFTGNNIADEELDEILAAEVHVTLDALDQLERFGQRHPGTDCALRINPDVSGGHHKHVMTGGPDSKFGIERARLADALAIAQRYDLVIDGLQQHIGSGILEPQTFMEALEVMLDAAKGLRSLKWVDFGGGFGIPYKPHSDPFDFAEFGKQAEARLTKFRKKERNHVAFRFEPGRVVVGNIGTLVVELTSIKRTNKHTFVGVNSGFNHLLRPILYNSYHHIENISKTEGPKENIALAGNVCESGDLFGQDRALIKPEVGDLIAIHDVGAYGFSMASSYNLRGRPAEVLIKGTGELQCIRTRESLDDMMRGTEFDA